MKSIQVNYEKEQIPADLLVLCLGPQARVHIKQHFDTVFPLITGQGYSIDLPDTDKKYDNDMHLKLGDRGYAYAQLEPGKHRIVSLMDFGCHDQAFKDPERVKHLTKLYNDDFQIEPVKGQSNEFRNLRTCLRPQSADDLPILGPMTYYPNVLLNLGHGGHGTSYSFACGKIISDLIEQPEKLYFDEQVMQSCDASRMLV